jgi:hypothetical protein
MKFMPTLSIPSGQRFSPAEQCLVCEPRARQRAGLDLLGTAEHRHLRVVRRLCHRGRRTPDCRA